MVDFEQGVQSTPLQPGLLGVRRHKAETMGHYAQACYQLRLASLHETWLKSASAVLFGPSSMCVYVSGVVQILSSMSAHVMLTHLLELKPWRVCAVASTRPLSRGVLHRKDFAKGIASGRFDQKLQPED